MRRKKSEDRIKATLLFCRGDWIAGKKGWNNKVYKGQGVNCEIIIKYKKTNK